MVDAGTQYASPPEPHHTPFLYRCIRQTFRSAAAIFYATTEVHGLENIPENGTPTILCFNHGNGLADPLVLIRKTPRMVRFCAKDTLWSVPVMKVFIRNSGAVPVYRAREHGEKAKDLNLDVFAKVIGALREGYCLGFAPEGVSRFLPYMEQPLKTGVARIALQAVEQGIEAGDERFQVAIVPVGLVYTHREKFRSDLCMRYVEPLYVNKSTLDRFRGADGKIDSYAAAKAITNELNVALDRVTINAPIWEVMNLAITATRLHQPTGTEMTLGQYLTLVRGWVGVLKVGVATPEDPATQERASSARDARVEKLRDALRTYQQMLDQKKIKCERVRRAALHGQALPWYWCVTGMAQRAVSVAIFFTVATPGLCFWAPVWQYVKRRERFLLSKGPRWNDSVAEMKMMVCTLFGMAVVAACLVRSLYSFSWEPLAFLYYMYVTMRCYEEGVADARSFFSHYRLLRLSPEAMGKLVEQRSVAKAAMDEAMPLLARDVTDHISLPADVARPTRALNYYFPYIIARFIMFFFRRRKKDWNEVLRLKDHTCMDYFE